MVSKFCEVSYNFFFIMRFYRMSADRIGNKKKSSLSISLRLDLTSFLNLLLFQFSLLFVYFLYSYNLYFIKRIYKEIVSFFLLLFSLNKILIFNSLLHSATGRFPYKGTIFNTGFIFIGDNLNSYLLSMNIFAKKLNQFRIENH